MHLVQRNLLRAARRHHDPTSVLVAPQKPPFSQSLHTDGRTRLSNFWAPTGGITKYVDPETGKEDSHNMLLRAGYIRQTHSGLYHFLPLGLRVQEKVEKLLDKHMRDVGASKVSLSTLSAVELWEKSGRWNADRTEFFRLEDRKGASYLLCPTHEEEITQLIADAVYSYKDLPLRLYQITRKYRDELRPRQGLLRMREFLMKDLYTFDQDRESAITTYEDVRKAYASFFDEFKLPYIVAQADSGNIGGEFSHEYHYPSQKGEDDVFRCNSCEHTINGELLGSPSASSDKPECPSCHTGTLTAHKTIELGHTFFLGTKYSAPLNARISLNEGQKAADAKAQQQTVPVEMGCHGIGVSRLVATMADLLCDDRGLQWPKVIAPFTVAIVPGKGNEDDAMVLHDILASMPPRAQVDTIIDDRVDKALGWKLNDADLIGYPVVVVLGRSWQSERRAEVQCRALQLKQDVDMVDLTAFIRDVLAKL